MGWFNHDLVLGAIPQQRRFFLFIQVTVTHKKSWCFRWGKQVRGGHAGKSEAKLTYCGAQGSLTCIRPIEEGEVRGPTGSTLMSNPLFDHQGTVPFFVNKIGPRC